MLEATTRREIWKAQTLIGSRMLVQDYVENGQIQHV